MSCVKGKVNVVKLHDTKFYCCDFSKEILHKGFTRLKLWSDAGFKSCPNCGTKLSINV